MSTILTTSYPAHIILLTTTIDQELIKFDNLGFYDDYENNNFNCWWLTIIRGYLVHFFMSVKVSYWCSKKNIQEEWHMKYSYYLTSYQNHLVDPWFQII